MIKGRRVNSSTAGESQSPGGRGAGEEVMLRNELERFKKEQREGLEGKFQKEVEAWARKVKITEERAAQQAAKLREQVRSKEKEAEKFYRKYKLEKKKAKELLGFIKR